MRSSLTILRVCAAAGTIAVALAGCETAMTGLVGPSKQEAEAAKAAATPPPPPPAMAAFVEDSALVPGFAGNGALAPTLESDPEAAGVDEPLPPASTGPHKPIAAVPIAAQGAALSPLGAAAVHEAKGGDAYFVLLVLTPAVNDAAALDRGTATARDAASRAIAAMGSAGVAADHIQIAMATNPNVGFGEIRLYRR